MPDRVALVEQTECEFHFFVVHVEDFRVEAGADHRLPAHGIGSAAEVGGEESVISLRQRKRVTPALDIVGLTVRFEDAQGEAGDRRFVLEGFGDFLQQVLVGDGNVAVEADRKSVV